MNTNKAKVLYHQKSFQSKRTGTALRKKSCTERLQTSKIDPDWIGIVGFFQTNEMWGNITNSIVWLKSFSTSKQAIPTVSTAIQK